jgi:hypothetical protein
MSLNTLGVGSDLAERYAVIGAEVEAGNADVACFQEVISWWHLRLLARRMRSFGPCELPVCAARAWIESEG